MTTADSEVRSSYFLFFPLVLVALVLDIIRLPEVVSAFRPDFLSLCIVFFAVYDPKRVNIGWAWLCGLLLDLLTGAPLSQNALCVALEIYIILSQFRRFAQFAKWQQLIILFVVNLLGHVLGYWISHLAGRVTYEGSIVLPSLITALLWPAVFYLCLFLCRSLNIAPDAPKENN